MRATMLLLLLCGVSPAATATEIRLWPNGAPGSAGKTAAEVVEPPNQDHGYLKVTGVHQPSLTVYLPPAGKSGGAAMIIAPGGGHAFLNFDQEGTYVAAYLNSIGVAAFVLKYRLAREPGSTYKVEEHALADAQRAIRLLRARAAEWNLNPSRIGIMGFSAGGEVAALAATGLRSGPGGTLESTATVAAGQTAKLGLVGISPTALQMIGAAQAVVAPPAPGRVSGLVWRDFSPSHPTDRGTVFSDEDGVAGLSVTLLGGDGSSAGSTVTDSHGDFTFTGVGSGTYRIQLDSSNFSSGFTGIYWLSGTQSLTPTSGLSQTAQALFSIPLVDLSMIIAYLWIWAGFAMVIIGAGLASLNREVLEAARIDGATEWQTFRRVTMPMLAPVLVVVLVTMIINVLKVFDIIVNMAPSTSQANTLAVAMYDYGFASSPSNNGLASAIALILFVLVMPVIYINLKRIR